MQSSSREGIRHEKFMRSSLKPGKEKMKVWEKKNGLLLRGSKRGRLWLPLKIRWFGEGGRLVPR